ncbi:DnaJ family domain-containing protein [Rossellomorea arthrocnemi]|uniref:DnaJ family domain-containing protein n=1 Tax=Rossellomorea arthrocnemi TaxID=2769542 RepID=UPI0019186C5D|nr:DnaJ family domain-containing protein [Rossellomorea arthrocnemi]
MDFSMIVSEHRIKKAYEDGEFKQLPGYGKPLNLDDDLGVPQELKMAHRMMKNAGYTTDEMNVKKEMMRIEDLIKVCDDDVKRHELEQNLNEKMLKYNAMLSKKRINTNSSLFKNYEHKLENRLLK